MGVDNYPGRRGGSYPGGGGEGVQTYSGEGQVWDSREGDKQPTAPPPPRYEDVCSKLT